MHAFYIGTLSLYIYTTFLEGTYGELSSAWFTYSMIFGLLYPFCYDSIQLYRSGWNYFNDPWNWSDMAFQWVGVVNIFFKFLIHE
jgi:hypothetical protein